MAYVTPTSRADGFVVDATRWNADVVDNPIALRTGALAVTSQATGDVIVASSATQLSRVAPSTAGTVLLSNGAGVAPSFGAAPGAEGTILTSNGAGVAPSFAVPVNQITLLKANSGTTTNAGAENVDTYAITGLTAKDTLWVLGSIEAVTQAVSTIAMYNSTDSVQIVPINDQGGAGDYAAGREGVFEVKLRQFQSASTLIGGMTDLQNDNNTRNSLGGTATFTTAWTGAWTLAFRHAGVVGGGTFKWSWAVYKIAGQ